MSGFDLEKRAEELLPPTTTASRAWIRVQAIRLATEALEAVEKDIECGLWTKDGHIAATRCITIIRSYIEKPGAPSGGEPAPRVPSSPDATQGERVPADAPPAPLALNGVVNLLAEEADKQRRKAQKRKK